MDRVTIIVPTYNVENYIAHCLESLVHQTYPDIDIHVIDDGSPAQEHVIVKRYQENYPGKIRYTRKPNGGYGSVLYEGIQGTNSPYFLVCDPDDWLELDAVETLVALAQRNQADIVCSARYTVDDEGVKTYDKMFNSKHGQIRDEMCYERTQEAFKLVYLIENAPHGKLFRRDCLRELYFPHKATNTDTILFFGAVFNSQRIVYTSKPLANYLILREGNTVTSVKPSLIDGMNTSHLETLNLAESYFDLSPSFYFQMLIAFHYICDRCVQLEGNQDLKKRKLIETSRMLNYLTKHRKKLLAFYKEIPSFRLSDYIKNILILNPLTKSIALNQLIRNRLNDQGKAYNFSVLNPLSERPIKISVIVPIYNVEAYLNRCLDSLKHQTFTDFEVVCVNDGSTDESQKIVDHYTQTDARFVSFIKENGGLSDARNFGIDRASGTFLFFLDSDDWIDSRTLELLYQRAITTQSDVVVCDMVYDYEDGHSIFASGGDFTCFDVPENDSVIAINNSACNKLYHHSLFNTRRFIKGIWYEDLATIPGLLLNANRISKVNSVLYHYFQRSNSIVHTENQKIFDIYTAMDEIKRTCEEKGWTYSLRKSYRFILLKHGLELTTIRIKDFDHHRKTYLKKNMNLFSNRYPLWYLDSMTWNQGLKRTVINLGLLVHAYSMVLWMYDRKGKV